MNRRAFLTNTVSRLSNSSSLNAEPLSPLSVRGLEPYKGSWKYEDAAHLLRRTMFGSKRSDVLDILSGSVEQAVERLLAPPTPPKPLHPIKYLGDGSDYPGDPSDWTHLAYVDPTTDSGWFSFFQTWYFKQMAEQQISVAEKLCLFWHNHFSTSYLVVKDARYMFLTHATIREHALGNFKELTKQITLDPGMLRYLNGNSNKKAGPNENYARELQELFTIGKGHEIKTGNYTTYCEDDVKAAARVLTGWEDEPMSVGRRFFPEHHETADKKFSDCYGNTVITGRSDEAGAIQELDDMLTMIFAQKATAKYICQKLYRWYVNTTITPEIEKEIITPLAEIFQKNKYEIKPVLKALFSSAHFFDEQHRGAIVKNPVDYGVSLVRVCPTDSYDVAGNFSDAFPPTNSTPLPSDTSNNLHYMMRPFRKALAAMQFDLCNAPSVAGLPAYYQEPDYDKLWINSDTLQKRIKLVDDLTTTHFEYDLYGSALMNVIQLAKQTSRPSDVTALQNDLIQMLFAVELSDEQKQKAQAKLLAGMTPEQWTQLWNDHLALPTNQQKIDTVDKRLRSLMRYLLGLAEFQLT